MRLTSRAIILLSSCILWIFSVSGVVHAAQGPGDAEIIEAQNTSSEAAPMGDDAIDMAQKWIQKKRFVSGWDPKKERVIVDGFAAAEIGPAQMGDFLGIRESLYVEASLAAKASIIESFQTTASAKNQLDIAGNPIAAQINEEKAALENLRRQQQQITVAAKQQAANMLAQVDNAQAEELNGVTFGDRLNRLLDAAIAKLDETYSQGELEEKQRKKVEDLKKGWERAQQFAAQASAKEAAIEKQIQEAQGKIVGGTRSKIELLSQMPLMGAVTLNQFESYNALSGEFQISVVVAWSPTLENEARSILLTQGERIPRPNKMDFTDWLLDQPIERMIGTKRYLPADGSINFMGISAVQYNPNDPGSINDAKFEADSWAKQYAILSLTASVESQKAAERLKQDVMGKDGKQESKIFSDMSVGIKESVENLNVSGLGIARWQRATHPASGLPIIVSVATVNSDQATKMPQMMADTYATLKEINEDQSFRVGQKEGMVAAAEASKNDPAARAAGYADGSGAVNQEFVNRNAAANRGTASQSQRTPTVSRQPAPAAQSGQAQSGSWGGDDDIDDDF